MDIVERISQLPPYNNPATALARKAAAEIERLRLELGMAQRTVADLSSERRTLQDELAARDAEIAAWLRGLPRCVNTRLCNDLADAIASGLYREKGSE